METVKKLSRGKGAFINCTDYDDALVFAKQQAIDFAKWTQKKFSQCELDEYSEDKMKYRERIISFDKLYEIFENEG